MSSPPGGGHPPSNGNGGQPASPRRDQLLSELAAEVRAARDEHRRDLTQVRARLDELTGLLGDNADVLSQTLPRVIDLDAEVVRLGERVDALSAPDDGQSLAPTDWPSLSAAEAEREWQALAAWVADVLGPFYEITRGQLPDCWPLHRPAVVELVWLRRCYVSAHRPDALTTAAAEWHTRWRRDALANIEAAIPAKWCRPGAHYVDRHDPHPGGGYYGAAGQQLRPRVPGERPGPGTQGYDDLEEVTQPQYWGHHWQTAVAADLAWRREREANADARQSAPAP
jgi:hypothetical protein